jgi:hypothetical protein
MMMEMMAVARKHDVQRTLCFDRLSTALLDSLLTFLVLHGNFD